MTVKLTLLRCFDSCLSYQSGKVKASKCAMLFSKCAERTRGSVYLF